MVIAIDGPAGAGKSTVARAVAVRLGFTYLDTGAMYRAVTVAGSPECEIAFDGERVLVDGHDVSAAIRTPEVSRQVSAVAADPVVRSALVAKQQAILSDGDWVAEGRDIALVVAPDAEVKVFLTADPVERARRRAQELGTDVDVVLRDQALRDAADEEGARSTLAPAPGATPLDTTGMSLDDVVDAIAGMLR